MDFHSFWTLGVSKVLSGVKSTKDRCHFVKRVNKKQQRISPLSYGCAYPRNSQYFLTAPGLTMRKDDLALTHQPTSEDFGPGGLPGP